jgi:hypothetical protein
MNDELIEESTTRAGFVRRLGKAVAIGLGVALVPATNAGARSLITCCRSASCDAGCPPDTPFGYLCPTTCQSCCACFNNPHLNCPSFTACPC